MVVGVPKEVKDHETRVALVPSGVMALCEAGHEVLVQTGAGAESAIPDDEYRWAGAVLVDSAADVWQPDTAMAGGITELVRIAGLASAMEVQLAPHCWGSAFLWAASLQLAGALPNYYIFEFGQAYSPLLYELVTTPVQVEPDGHVKIPTGPGLGVEIIPDAEQRFPFDAHAAERRALV